MNNKITKSEADILIKQYIQGWKSNSIDHIISVLSDDIVVIESHGPKYIGLKAIEQWFNLWLTAQSQVNKWEINSFNFCEENQTAFCEWDFACISNKQEYIVQGISLIKFAQYKICHIHEYRMTKAEYLWTGKTLNSI